nr:MAG TPA: hypothetical protein [Caudoviricetes sp.]
MLGQNAKRKRQGRSRSEVSAEIKQSDSCIRSPLWQISGRIKDRETKQCAEI